MIRTTQPGPARSPTQRLLHLVLLGGPSPRAELARTLGMSPASLTRLAAPLIGDGMIRELSVRHEPRSGRPSRPLDIVPECRLFVGVKLTGTEAYGVLTGLRGQILADRRLPLEDRDPSAAASVIADLYETLVAQGSPDAVRPTMVGVSVGGQVHDHRVVRFAPFLGWEDVDLGSILDSTVDATVVIDNDVVALTKGLHWSGDPGTTDRLAVITIGAGVGYGLIMHGEVVESSDVGVGLLGHYPLDRQGPPCAEGHRGCAAAVLTTSAVQGLASMIMRRNVGFEDTIRLAEDGHPGVLLIINDAAEALGRLIGSVAGITMTGRVVLTGEALPLATVGADALARGLREAVNSRGDPVRLDLVDHDFRTWAQGAAISAIQEWLEDPLPHHDTPQESRIK